MAEIPEELAATLARNPVIAAVFGVENVPSFLASECRVCILASVALHELEGLITVLSGAGKFTFVNIDACSGLGQDRGAVEYLKKIGVPGVVSTKTALIQRANAVGMVTMHKVFVTDRSNLPRSALAVEQSKPALVQIMPWPVVSHLEAGEIRALSPYIAAGFIKTGADVAAALRAGATGVSSSSPELWDMAGRQ
ncbi:glycerol-3-phosphate responsive antiterminator [Arthrobacter sp. GMC3]|uniref:glycerol-3-phosphate responsive antiterminator n=1 Tax=Arthrobacter sp. GMC3 TaxID=2058894 RepID=UPI001C67D54C|nr:glycerol-3-phosphate responsive antiterminator [Arthrobacter sp. GMC3]